MCVCVCVCVCVVYIALLRNALKLFGGCPLAVHIGDSFVLFVSGFGRMPETERGLEE